MARISTVAAGSGSRGRVSGGRAAGAGLDFEMVLNALGKAILLVDQDGNIRYANATAEQFFATGATVLSRMRLDQVAPFAHPLLAVVEQVRQRGISVFEYEVDFGSPKTGHRSVDMQVTPLADNTGLMLISLQERAIAQRIDRQLTHRGAARSVTGMAAILAHEIKNPLSGIRGAAQLIEQGVGESDRELTRLICDEADRICSLVDRMEAFNEGQPITRDPVNIHVVLEHVKKIAMNGFAKGIRFIETYDPSLPPVPGDRDQLIQVFLNLVKNASEAVPAKGGEITLTTAYRHGVRMAVPGTRRRLRLPLEVTVRDNGEGVPPDLKPHLFEPFVTTKSSGTGLGLALVAKVIGDHGGMIECESEPRRTVFRVLLPVATE